MDTKEAAGALDGTRRGPSGLLDGGSVIAPACTEAGTACAVWLASAAWLLSNRCWNLE